MLSSALRKLVIVLTDGCSLEHCIAIALFCRSVYRIYRAKGALFLALYLKQCRSTLIKVYGVDLDRSYSVAISVTRTGYPRIIAWRIGRYVGPGLSVV